MCVSVWKGGERVWSRARDDYQPGSLGSCFLSADVAPVIQLAGLLSDCRATRSLVGQPGPLLQHGNAILWRAGEVQREDERMLTLQQLQVLPVGPSRG